MTIPAFHADSCYMEECKEYKNPTSMTMSYQGQVIRLPIPAFRLEEEGFNGSQAIGLIALSKEVLKHSRPLTPAERAGADAFVWSHFK
jgi:hypothetical protein